MKYIFTLLILIICSCKQDEVEPDSFARLRMPQGSLVSIVTEDPMTKEKNKISFKPDQGEVLAYRFEEGKEGEGIPTYMDLVNSMIGSKNKRSKSEYPTVNLPSGTLQILEMADERAFNTRLKFLWQMPNHPQLQYLRKNEKLDDLIDPNSEWQTFVNVSNWTRDQWQPSSPKLYPSWNANQILSLIRAGKTGGFCGQYTQVLSQALTSLGYNTRYLWLDAHFALEVFSNDLNKWVVLDPFYYAIYQYEDEYLNALELYELSKDTAKLAAVKIVNTKTNVEVDGAERTKILNHYRSFVIDLKNTHLEERRGGSSYNSTYWEHAAMYADAQNLTFDFISAPPIMTPWKQDLYFGLNQCAYRVLAVDEKALTVGFKTNTPFHSHFELSSDGKVFKEVPNRLQLPIQKGESSYYLRSVNSMGIAGPLAKMVLDFK